MHLKRNKCFCRFAASFNAEVAQLVEHQLPKLMLPKITKTNKINETRNYQAFQRVREHQPHSTLSTKMTKMRLFLLKCFTNVLQNITFVRPICQNMITFHPVVLKHHIKPDKTARIKIRVTHNRVSKYIDTRLVVTTSDLNKSFEIKNTAFIDATNDIVRQYRHKCKLIEDRIDFMSTQDVLDYLNEGVTKQVPAVSAPDPEKELDFIAFARSRNEKLIADGKEGTAQNNSTAINTLIRFTGRQDLPVNMINVKFLTEFEEFIRQNCSTKFKKAASRAPSLYLGRVRTLHNEMKLQYNDEDTGVIRVPLNPFNKFKIPVEKATRKRAIDAALVNRIMNLPDDNSINSGGGNRFNLAKDCFTLSFCLVGMNSSDLYNCPPPKGNYETYKRMKTKDRRSDQAEITIRIEPEIKALMQKYKDPTGKRAFNFYHTYASEQGLNQAINKGLKQIEKHINMQLQDEGEAPALNDLEYYAARHSWATIALNKVNIDKYTVHEALNHVDESMRVTDIYLERDWTRVHDANRKVLDYVKEAKYVPAKKRKRK